MKKLFLINNNFGTAAQYGIRTYIRELTNCLFSTEWKIYVVELCCRDYEEVEIQQQSGVNYLYIPMISHFTQKNSDVYNRNVAYIMMLFFQLEDDVVFHFNYFHHYLLSKTLRKLCPQGKQILTVHYFDWIFALTGNEARFLNIVERGKKKEDMTGDESTIYSQFMSDRKFFHTVDKVVVLCEHTAQFVQNTYSVEAGKIILIRNGLKDEAVFLSEEEKKVQKTALGFSSTDRIVLFVGRIDRLKGIELLLQAFINVINSMSDVHLLLVGTGKIEEYLGMCSGHWKNIHFTGNMEKHQLYNYYQIADIGVLPSYSEQCSYVGIEMLMHGLPFVATDKGGLREMFGERNKYCLNMENESQFIISLTQILLFLLKDESELKKCSIECRKSYKTRYREENWLLYKNLYQSI